MSKQLSAKEVTVKLYQLACGEEFVSSDHDHVIESFRRVPGGWLCYLLANSGNGGCCHTVTFIPFSREFYGEYLRTKHKKTDGK